MGGMRAGEARVSLPFKANTPEKPEFGNITQRQVLSIKALAAESDGSSLLALACGGRNATEPRAVRGASEV